MAGHRSHTFTDPATETAGVSSAPPRMFVPPSQFSHLGLPVPAEENLVVGFNKFNPAMTTHLFEGHPGPGGGEFFYTSRVRLNSRNASWPSNTPIIDRKVTDAPPRAMELKPVLMRVDQSGLTALPFWQGPSASTDPDCAGVTSAAVRNTAVTTGVIDCHPSPSTWTHCVLVDPAGTTTSLRPATTRS